MPIFKQKIFRKKWRPFWIFRKIAKHKNASISKTVLDRAISTKFLTHWVSLQSSHAYFQKNFVLPKMAAILNFRIFAQKLQNTKMLIFRKPCYIEQFWRNFLSSGYLCRVAMPIFKQKIFRKKWRPFWIFEFFAKLQNTKMLISRKPC